MATMIQAIRMALHVGESRLGVTDIFGEDVGAPLGGVFHVVSRPCVAVNTPPSGGPTSSPKMSVTPSLVSPTCSAMRTAWTIVAISALHPCSDHCHCRGHCRSAS